MAIRVAAAANWSPRSVTIEMAPETLSLPAMEPIMAGTRYSSTRQPSAPRLPSQPPASHNLAGVQLGIPNLSNRIALG